MRKWNNWRNGLNKWISNSDLIPRLRLPATKVVAANTVLFLLWKFFDISGMSSNFLVRHFSFHKQNIQEHRYHTMITYAVSHLSSLTFLFNMAAIWTFGRSISLRYGNKIFWMLYVLGSLSGSLAMHFGMPHITNVVPQVGAAGPVFAMTTFYALLNFTSPPFFTLLFIPISAWSLLAANGVFCYLDPSRKSLGGVVAGLLLYGLFKIKLI